MISLLCVVKDPVNFHHWLSWNSRYANEILIYDHDSETPEKERGNIRVFHHAECQVESDPEHGLQTNVYNFLLQYCNSKYVLPIDDDEYILEDLHNTINIVLDVPCRGSMKLCRKTFGPNGHVKTSDVNPLTNYPFYTKWDYGTKTVSKLDAINRIDTHSSFLKQSFVCVDTVGNVVDPQGLHLENDGKLLEPCYHNTWINHYRYLSYEDIERKNTRGTFEFAREGDFYNKTLDEIYQLKSFESKEALIKTCQPTGICYYRNGELINQEFDV